MVDILNLIVAPFIWIYRNINKRRKLKIYKQYIIELLDFIQIPDCYYDFYFGVEMSFLGQNKAIIHCSDDEEVIIHQAIYRLAKKYQLTIEEKRNILTILQSTTPGIIYQGYNNFEKNLPFFFCVSDKDGKIIHKEISPRYIYKLVSREQIQQFLENLPCKKFDNIIKQYL
ncbi:MAG: hypothetical protein ACRC0X_01950 [Brevinema sp.]